MDFKKISLFKEAGIAVAKITREESKVFNSLLFKELMQLVAWVEKDAEVDVLIITGEGNSFADEIEISEMIEMHANRSLIFGDVRSAAFRSIEKMQKPTIAAIDGLTLGSGCELALCCDMRIANEKAQFGRPELWSDIIPGFRGKQRFLKFISTNRVEDLVHTGGLLDAKEALRLGLVSCVVACDELMEKAFHTAKDIQTYGGLEIIK
ncbi:enoyl-CoA hydratase-related protein [Fusibacter ferrireducens]|uniref:Enoyl-CoA hydratase/isomerase family protein n=1 Tax=Fusibacter ferrireducens TaxID=2785058 RepID=A0ABR9ZW87_9FIRM|nr:enoyl-CoA hydratase-related protein [Fusibacter ferrireducens]MBF4694703.1 enoyl-CoA hydratase/isomerase family protein [Fusibacter ferrireducens]